MLVKLLVSELFITSMEVSVPTSAVIPSAIIKMVRKARSACPRIEESATERFSRKDEFTCEITQFKTDKNASGKAEMMLQGLEIKSTICKFLAPVERFAMQ